MLSTISPKRARLVAFFRKVPQVTYEELRRCWLHDVGSRFAGLEVVKANILLYEQCHVDRHILDKLVQGGYNVPKFDGFAVLEAESFDKLNEVLTSQEWKTNIGPIEGSVIDILNPKIIACSNVESQGQSGASSLRYAIIDGHGEVSLSENSFRTWMTPIDTTNNKPLLFIDGDDISFSELGRYCGEILPVKVETIISHV
ncbi:hypothetical protein VKT23_016634 [Stygiomarasmius scandens]|uniref:Uncharacterized protein n=1 Tax=Marasmiellus scandens TaxID=2682957 RepID=A0ABR1IYV7_9AGAR